jgi:hypothetical protein
MDRNDCHTAWGDFKTLISSLHHNKNYACSLSLIVFLWFFVMCYFYLSDLVSPSTGWKSQLFLPLAGATKCMSCKMFVRILWSGHWKGKMMSGLIKRKEKCRAKASYLVKNHVSLAKTCFTAYMGSHISFWLPYPMSYFCLIFHYPTGIEWTRKEGEKKGARVQLSQNMSRGRKKGTISRQSR